MDTRKRLALACAGAATMLMASSLAAGPASADGWTETTGAERANKTFTDYHNAGGPLGPELPPNTTVQISCRIQGFMVEGGNDWWYRIASAPWSNRFYASADGFYNNGATSGSLSGTPPVDTTIPLCELGTSTDTDSPAGSSGTIINGIDVGTPQNERHQWGSCTVQDFNGGPLGWLILDYTHGINIVHGGMLWGWFDLGGGPGLGCARNAEHGSALVATAHLQEFDNGSLYWATGMDHAKRYTPTCTWAVRWERRDLTFSYVGDHRYLGNALQAAQNWSRAAPGLRITQAPLGMEGDIVIVDYNDGDGTNGEAMVPEEMKIRGTETTVFKSPQMVRIRVNMRYMDEFEGQDVSPFWRSATRDELDFARTQVLTHEFGHALGLAHPDACGMNVSSVMNSGHKGQFSQGFNDPQFFDMVNIRELYGLPI